MPLNHSYSRLTFGTVETGKKGRLKHKKYRLEEEKDKLEHKKAATRGRLKYKVVRGKTLLGLGLKKEQIRKRRLIFPGEKVVSGKSITFKEKSREELTEKNYRRYLFKSDAKKVLYRYRRREYVRTGKNLLSDANIAEDETSAELRAGIKKSSRRNVRRLERNIKKIRKQTNPYTRLRHMDTKADLLEQKMKLLDNQISREGYKVRMSSASSAYQKKKLKKDMVSSVRTREGNWIKRNTHKVLLKKKERAEWVRRIKSFFSVFSSLLVIIAIVIIIFILIFLLIMMVAEGVTMYTGRAITQNDYHTLSSATAYLRELETELEEYLIDPDQVVEDIIAEYGNVIANSDYEMPEFGFSSTILMSYLSVKYISFTLDEVKDELDEIFREMYRIVVNEEGSIVIEKTELEDVIEGRMNEEEKEQYENYRLSGGGQQVYGPVMREDWTNLITSGCGERIHPITGVRTFHNGTDIGIPTGTPLYSAIKGTVTTARYSDTAGYYLTVTSESGWTVTFMHMDSMDVSVGNEVEQGDYLGDSGNTGRSTGPHLHLEVRDPQGNVIDPVFIIPQSTYQYTEVGDE